VTSSLHVVVVLSNPWEFNTRYAHFERFLKQMLAAKVHVTAVELTYDDRVTIADRIYDRLVERKEEAGREDFNLIRVRTRDVLWHKENLVNLGISQLPEDWRMCAWIDADIAFHNPNWVADTIKALNHYEVVQMWSQAVDLAPDHTPINCDKTTHSFMYAYRNGLTTRSGRYDDLNWHPGYAWAMRRHAWEEVGGLLDTAILGAGDRHMAMAMIGKAELSYPPRVTDAYKESVLAWQRLSRAHHERNVGYVPGLVTHWHHGPKRLRRYHDRWQILERGVFNPFTDLRMDRGQGLWRWADGNSERMQRMRDEVREYFLIRNEDSTEL
jgi:glycosyltransferase involved in cell wall biosynthesis